MYRARAIVDLNVIRRNVVSILQRLEPGATCLAVVKADGYGHGAVQVARAALEAGASGAAVTTCEEADDLRRGGYKGPILIMGPVLNDQLDEAILTGADLAVWNRDFATSASRAATRLGRQVRLHLKIDTGMHRLGVRPQRLGELADLVWTSPGLGLHALMTHFATADCDPGCMFEQLRLFLDLAAPLRAAHPDLLLHAANSAATFGESSTHLDLVRCGVALYGMSPFQRNPAEDGLSPALSLTSYVAALRDLEPGEGVSYGLTWRASSSTRIALVPMGYGDGFFRAHSNKGDVLIRGARYPRVGTVCMDQFMVEVGRDSPVRFGDRVVLVGSDGGEMLRAEELAAEVGTINYEVTCSLTARVRREYLGASRNGAEDHG